jgi:hypothetical protein
MAAFVKFHSFITALATGGHNLSSDTLKVALSNTAPVAATDTVWSAGAFPPPLAANGYSSGGASLTQLDGPSGLGVYTLTLTEPVFTAAGGSIGPFRYAIIYNVTAGNKLIGYYDYGSSITITSGNTFTIDFSAVSGTLTIE